ncbi:MAG: hypothetical protein ACRC6M_19545 [Microcystaceae cyanobacterium]
MPLTYDPQTLKTAALLTCYGFDLSGLTPIKTLERWLESYPILWIRLAVVEALYQGRYKSISVEQLLKFWLKRGHPLFHFNQEFERLISHKLPKILLQPSRHDDEQISDRVPPTLSDLPKQLAPSEVTIFSEAPFSPPPQPLTVLSPFKSLFTQDYPSLTEISAEIITPEPELTPITESSPDLAVLDELEWSEVAVESWSAETKSVLDQRTIHQFHPQRERSPWFDKLKMVLQQELAQTAL